MGIRFLTTCPQISFSIPAAKTDFTSSSWTCRPGRTMRSIEQSPATFVWRAPFYRSGVKIPHPDLPQMFTGDLIDFPNVPFLRRHGIRKMSSSVAVETPRAYLVHGKRRTPAKRNASSHILERRSHQLPALQWRNLPNHRPHPWRCKIPLMTTTPRPALV